jgi:beta-glucan synthesis-associated protein KRE6
MDFKEEDDFLHNPDPRRDKRNDQGGSIFTMRGAANLGCLLVLLLGLLSLL